MRQATVTSTEMSLPSTVLNSTSSVVSVFDDFTIFKFCSLVSKVCQSVMKGVNMYVAPGA